MSKQSRQERKDAVAKLRAADKALHDNSSREKAAGIRDETPEYLRLNAAANEAAKNVSWWRR